MTCRGMSFILKSGVEDMDLMNVSSLDAAIRGCFGESVRIERELRVSGGDINDARCLFLSNAEQVFVKSTAARRADMFAAEAAGLLAIAATKTARTPHVLCRGVDEGLGISFLMMEMVRSGKKAADYWEVFGRELAAMHLADTKTLSGDGRFGFPRDNYIGSTPQSNGGRNSWVDFFRDCRLVPQVKMARRYLDAAVRRRFDRLLDRLDAFLTEPDRPSLLHGDLWSGNILPGSDGKAWLIDPAVYVGHAEADLAMTELFGRLPERFYGAYREVNPISPDYEARRDLYNLYHLLNHLNLFGPGYYSSVVTALRRYQ